MQVQMRLPKNEAAKLIELSRQAGRKLTTNAMKQALCMMAAEHFAERDEFKCFAALLERELLRDAADAYTDARTALREANRAPWLYRLIEREPPAPVGETPQVPNLPGNRYYG